MSLTWKDFITTVLAVMTVGLYYAISKDIPLPVITGYRGAILVLGIFGIVMCAMSGGTTSPTGMYMIVASILGIAALILIVYGLITGAKMAFMLLTGTILILWVISTMRHLLVR